MISSLLIGKAVDKSLDLAIDKLKSTVKEHIQRVKINRTHIEESLDIHLKMVDTWSAAIKFKDLNEEKWLSKIFVHLDYYLTPSSSMFEDNDESIRLEEIVKIDKNIVILGQPGAGKTTSMKFICQKVLFDENFFPDTYSFPIVIRFRELNYQNNENDSSTIIFSELYDILGLNISYYQTGKDKEKINTLIKKAVISFIDILSPIIIFDGFDEIANFAIKEMIFKEIELLSLHLKNAKFILTSRTGEFHYSLSNTREFEISPLKEVQIIEFTQKWLGDNAKALALFNQLKNSPFYDTTMRPLTLAHLTAIYEREGKIPEKPKTVYRKVVNLLLEEWSNQQGIKRTSHFSNFEVDRKLEFLSHLAYQLTSEYSKAVFSTLDLQNAYIEIHDNFGLPKKDAINVVQELESHNGLFIQTGYERFQFPHKSIQEYLTADFLVKSWALPSIDVLLRIPNELALAISISSVPSNYFAALILNLLRDKIRNPNFIEPFVNRLIIEKPDFQSNLAIGVSFTCIYHFCFYQDPDNIEDSGYGYPGLRELLNTLFRNFKAIRDSIQFLREFYDITAIKTSTGGDILLKRNSKKINEAIYSINYPNELISRVVYFEVTDPKKIKL